MQPSLTVRSTGTNKENPCRRIYINDAPRNAMGQWLHNCISTAKYNVLTFLPKFLMQEFSKYANVFFLFTACIQVCLLSKSLAGISRSEVLLFTIIFVQQIDGVSPTSRFTTAVPLAIVLMATAFKEIVEDYKRHKSDASVNASRAKVLVGTTFVEKPWSDIAVGDLVRIEGGEFFPADLILLSSSEPEGLCYIETSNLDGETNLKIRQALPETSKMCSPHEIAQLGGYIKSETPNNSLYTYTGTITIGDLAKADKELPLEPMQLLLRGARLRNTRWIYGIVVFTGHETKLMRNASATPIKRTSVERMTNVQIIFLFAILMALSIACAVGNLIVQLKYSDNLWYLMLSSTDGGSIAIQFIKDILTFLILFNNLIPISLIVTMEVVKYEQAALINSDLDMYYEKTDTPALARTSSLVEELGQIEYVFSDKTGTLTCNVMEFRQCSIGGIGYSGVVEGQKKTDLDENRAEFPGGLYTFGQLRENQKTHETKNVISQFLTLLAVCHTVIPEINEETKEIQYQASSPDEAALVSGAASLGYQFTTRKPKTILVDINGKSEEFEVLNICEFNSTRKRMSAVLRCPDGRIRLYCKGADTVILERLGNANPFVEQTLEHLEEYASEGLRTLCLAVRDIPEEEFRAWSGVYERAATQLVNRQEELDKAAELIEKNLFLLGATAIEDKLQDGVPETIHTLAQAGIKIWVLTGDRQETAINIGYSCKLIMEDYSLIICNEESLSATRDFLQLKLSAVKQAYEQVDIDAQELEPMCLIIDGSSLTHALDKQVELMFLELAMLCKAVICCRVSPLQKALVVKLVKKRAKSILLAIGDGANDVSMIQAAHVGVGISGMEGLQAARSADFAISQFRFLRKLLLVHGAWSYQRLSKLILYSFYKNITLYMTQFWYVFFNGFSGQVIYESWTITFYNVFFTVAPPIVLGVFDQHVSARMLDRYPQMYMLGQRGEFFNVRSFWGWTANAFYHSLLLFFGVTAIFWMDLISPMGYVFGHWAWGTTMYTAVLATVLLKAALITDHWTKYAYIAIPGSFAFWMVFLPIYGAVAPLVHFSEELEYLAPIIFGSAVFWLTVVIVPTTCIFRDYVWKYGKRIYAPRAYHYVQEIQKFNIPDYRPRMERFRKAVHKVRMIQRLRRNRGYAFSQNESGQANLIRQYDTTRRKPRG